MIDFMEILDRAHGGRVCEQKDWNVRLIPGKVREKLRDHELENTCDRQDPINSDDSLADAFWSAGFELAVELGMLCLETNRMINFTEAELKDALRETPNELSFGEGPDRRTLRHRAPEGESNPLFRSGFCTVSESMYLDLLQGIAREPAVDFISPLAPDTLRGRKPMAGTPYETLGGHHEAVLAKQAIQKAGRPGAPIVGLATSPTEHGQLGGYGTTGGLEPNKDIGLVLPITELKTSYGLLHKVALMTQILKGTIFGSHWSMIGGYVGPAEGAVLTAVASTVLQIPVHQSPFPTGVILDIKYGGNCGRDAVWAGSVAHQAVSRNTGMCVAGITSQVFGPCTREMLYEIAVGSINDAVSGCSWQAGNRPAAGVRLNHITPLEQRFGSEVLKSAAGLRRTEAAELVNSLLPRYEDKLQHPDRGRAFDRCYNAKSLKPTDEWLGFYNGVWTELEDLGLENIAR